MAKKTTSTGPEPMDANAPEVSGEGRVSSNTARNVYALDTLVAEVLELFPETDISVSDVDGRNAAHDVQFSYSEGGSELESLLTLVGDDERVNEVLIDETSVLVAFTHNARLKDNREPFHLGDAFSVLTDPEDEGSL